MENIRLVIWDLDNTLWNGILSEETVSLTEEHKHLIENLVGRGIMNSICSKNNLEEVKAFLQKEEIWEYFVFPSISWEPKGNRVKSIIESFQLRPQSVLFIDDDNLNLEEVKFYIPGIETSLPDIMKTMLENACFQGKNDKNHTRLKQYKLLEQKKNEQVAFSSNEEFLLNSNICVEMQDDCLENFDRIFELIERTNQLNFTKKRVDKESLLSLLKNKEVKCLYITVHDKYGDYGITGFVCKASNTVEHFLFSCRTLGLGVEQWVYAQLGYPELKVVGETAVKLNNTDCPCWININQSRTSKEKTITNSVSVLMVGSCDLEQVSYYIDNNGVEIKTEFNYMHNGFTVHKDHMELLLGSLRYSSQEQNTLIHSVPFFNSEVFHTNFFNSNYKIVVYSPLINYSLGLYRHKTCTNMVVPYGNFDIPLSAKDSSNSGIPLSFLDDFEFIGRLTAERFKENLVLLRNNMDSDTVLILLNGSEQNVEHPEEKDRYKYHKIYNDILLKFCADVPNTYLVDVNEFIEGSNDHTDTIRHYTRRIYRQIAVRLIELIKENSTASPTFKETKRNFSAVKMTKTFLRRAKLYNTAYFVYRKLNRNIGKNHVTR